MPSCTPSEAYCSLSPAEVITAHFWPHTKEGLIGDTLGRGNSGWMASFCCFKWVWGAAHSSSFTTTDRLEDHLCLNRFSSMTAEPYQFSTSLPRGSEEVRHLSREPKAETQMNTTHDGLRLWLVPPRAAPGAVRRPCRKGRRQEAEWHRGDGSGFGPPGAQKGLVFPESSANNALCDMTGSLIKTRFSHLSKSDDS